MNMQTSDILKLANACRSQVESPFYFDGFRLARVNNQLLHKYSRGKAKFEAHLRQLISRSPVIRCNWGHVGKNH